MERRAFLFALIVASGCGQKDPPDRTTDGGADRSSPIGVKQQSAGTVPQTKVPLVAILVYGTRGSATATAPSTTAILIRNRLAELGYVEGKTIAFDERYAEGDLQRLTQLARELVASKPDVIVAIAAAATVAARKETSTIPIVMAHASWAFIEAKSACRCFGCTSRSL